MPIIPSVFQPIKQNDVQQRPIKAYKRYRISGPGFANDGYIAHDGVYRDNVPHIFADTGQGVGTRVFPVNAIDATNKHVLFVIGSIKFIASSTPPDFLIAIFKAISRPICLMSFFILYTPNYINNK